MMLPGGVLPWFGLERAAAAIAPLGWHIDVQLDRRTLGEHEAMLGRLPCRLVSTSSAVSWPRSAPRAMGPWRCYACRRRPLLDKISAPYESSKSGPPGYDDIAWIARKVAERCPERCLWASNWPHPNQHPAPADAAMLEWGLGCTASTSARRRALVDNPAELYGFAPLAS